jgi:hypothetical protein
MQSQLNASRTKTLESVYFTALWKDIRILMANVQLKANHRAEDKLP